MAKLTGEIVYGLENKEKLKRIVDALSIKKHKWDDLDLDFFDEISEVGDDQLDGHTDKHFYLCSVKEFPDLVSELKNNENCGYVTPINDVAKEGIYPKKISTLLKYNSDMHIVNEVLASQIMNLFGLPTSYNFYIETGKPYDKYIGSVDMLSGNQRFYTLPDLQLTFYMCLDNMMEDEFFFNYLRKSGENLDLELSFNEEKLREQLISTYLVRECLLADGDFSAGNCGFLIDSETAETKFVNFDYEMVLMGANTESMRNVIYRSLEYAYDYAPKIYDEFIKKVKELHKVMVEVEIECVNDDHKYALGQLQNNADKILNFDRLMKTNFEDPIKE